ncbi:MAG: glycosyl hydrolase-related protein [Caldilineaceae bacterium]
MGNRELIQLSRRNLLKTGAILLTGATSAHLLRLGDHYRLFSQENVKRLYIAPDEHTDYMWTADEETYRQAFLEMLDYYLDLADVTANELSEHQSRWNCDGSFWMWTYEQNRPAADFERLINRIRSGHISVPLTALVSCYGGAPAEAVLRGMYYPGQIERRYNVRFTLAVSMENQTLPYGLGALWAGAGAKYSWKGVCGCASKVPGLQKREHEIYWWIGPDGSKILMKWYSLLGNQLLGGYAEARDPAVAVDLLDAKAASADYPYSVAGAFGKGWDDLKTLTDEFVTVAKSKTNANRRVIVSNEEDFFQDFETNYGTSLPSISSSFGNEWELYCASMAEVSAQVKRSVEKLRNAEALATLVTLQDVSFMHARTTARDLAWMNLGLYWEHDWTADGPVGRNARREWQRRLASEIASYVDGLSADAITALGGMIRKNSSNVRFFVFNALSWTRTDVADLPYTGAAPLHVIDLTTGLEAPSQIVMLNNRRYLRILANQVPAVGYKVFEVRSGPGQGFANALSADASTGVIQNSIYQVTVVPRGAILSLQDKTRANREFVRDISGYVINDLHRVNDPANPSATGVLSVENVGPVSVTLVATTSSATPLQHTTRITLLRDSNRIDIQNEITQNFSDVYTWRYGFNLASPDVWHEEVGAMIRAKLLADGGHYSPNNARYDWLTLNHFADMSSGDIGVTLSNADCYYMQLGNSTADILDTETSQFSPLVGGQVDGSSLGILDQGGDSYFLQRFALKTHAAYDPASAMIFALEHQNPLVAGIVSGGDAYPETFYSLLTISNPNVLLWALKPADDGIEQGIVTRLWNLSDVPVDFTLTYSPGDIATAKETTHLETPVGNATVDNGALTGSLASQQLKTFSVQLNTDPSAPTRTPTPTSVEVATPTATSTETVLPTPTPCSTPSPTLRATSTPTLISTGTSSPNITPTRNSTPTFVPSVTAETTAECVKDLFLPLIQK